MKFATFIAAPPAMAVSEFIEWFDTDYCAFLGSIEPRPAGAVSRTVVPMPTGDAMHPALQDLSGPNFPAYHAVLETWFSSTEDFRRAMIPQELRLRAMGATFVSVRVNPMLEKDPRIAESGEDGKRPELTFIMPISFVAGVPKEEAKRHWSEHPPLALRIHRCLSKYERNWVDEVMTYSDGNVPMEGFGDFSVARAQDVTTDFFPEDSGHEIFNDVDCFIDGHSVIYLGDPKRLVYWS